jgi:hypothetical protein
MVAPTVERAPLFVGCVTLLAGTVLVAAADRVCDGLGLDGQKRAVRVVGASDLVLVPGLLGGRPRWPWMLGRAALNVAQAGYLHRMAPRSASPAALERGAALLLGLTVVDGATALALRRAGS